MRKKKEVVAGRGAARAYIELDTKLMQEVVLLATKYPSDYKKQWERKWEIFEQCNRAWDKLSRGDKAKVLGHRPTQVTSSTTINEAMSRKNFYRKEIDKGVYGRDLIQPLNPDGTPNLEFVEHYGIANYDTQQKEYIRNKMGRDLSRERDWRSEKK